MKLPSIQNLQEKTIETFVRFPLAILSGLVISIIGVVLIELGNTFTSDQIDQIARIIFALVFAFPLFGSITLLKERNKWETDKVLLANFVVLVLTLAYFFLILQKPMEDWDTTEGVRVFILSFCAYLFGNFAPFLGKQENKGLWQYNKLLFNSGALTAVYCGVLFLGITLTLVSVDFLFDIRIHDELYGDIFVLIAGVMAPLTLFSQIPRDLSKLEKSEKPHQLVKKFAQYILVPLVSIYTLILYLYAAKILISQEWPEGIIGWMIIMYAAVGIVTNILLYPFQNTKENAWIKKYSKWFYILLIPITGMLFAALGIRISEYAFTESRYYVLVLGIWLVGISGYFIFNKKEDLKLIPLSITTVLVLTLFGPWSAFEVSENSQVERFKEILSNSTNNELSETNSKEANEIINYLYRNHDLSELVPLFEDQIPEFSKLSKSEQRRGIKDLLKLKDNYSLRDVRKYFYVDESEPQKIAGYQYLSRVHFSKYGSHHKKVTLDKVYETKLVKNSIILENPNVGKIEISLKDFVKELLQEKSDHKKLQRKDMFIETTTEKIKLKLYIQNISLDTEDNEIRDLYGNLMIGF